MSYENFDKCDEGFPAGKVLLVGYIVPSQDVLDDKTIKKVGYYQQSITTKGGTFDDVFLVTIDRRSETDRIGQPFSFSRRGGNDSIVVYSDNTVKNGDRVFHQGTDMPVTKGNGAMSENFVGYARSDALPVGDGRYTVNLIRSGSL